ncbi:MAG: PQQ-dependent sugar dehydrogenase [Nitrososphaera sp.]|uniref:PQQ-dependent sugar dehydrogenase n=1 Tax=Candidatus Nitrososphaera gargensis TaxID=497727 RepID=UPI001650A3D8|nr:PQQ-dependent sugar dehydrogenase [Candidatus Nitrososphaera gargensis]
MCWPTVAPSSLRLYTSDVIPDWNGTFLMPTLKGGRIFHLALDECGAELASDPVELFRSENRYRDLAFSPDSKSIYVIILTRLGQCRLLGTAAVRSLTSRTQAH